MTQCHNPVKQCHMRLKFDKRAKYSDAKLQTKKNEIKRPRMGEVYNNL